MEVNHVWCEPCTFVAIAAKSKEFCCRHYVCLENYEEESSRLLEEWSESGEIDVRFPVFIFRGVVAARAAADFYLKSIDQDTAVEIMTKDDIVPINDVIITEGEPGGQ
jgi:hypothetical protein